MNRQTTGISGYSGGATAARVPGVPIFYEKDQYSITAANNKLVMSYDGGADTTITISAGVYTGAALATEMQTQVNTALGSSGTAGYANTVFSFDAGSGHTFSITTGGANDIAGDIGFTENAAAAQILTSDSITQGTGDTITFTVDDSGNADEVEYAIYDNTQASYIDTDGSTSGSAVWDTLANWDNGGATGRITVTGLTAFTEYTYKAKARNELGVETDFSANSSSMNTLPSIDYGERSEELNIEVTTGNTKIKLASLTDADGNAADITVTGEYGDITLTYILQNNYGTTSRVIVEYSEDNSNWAAATKGTGGDAITELATSAAGTQHTFVWDSYTDAGKSESDTSVYLRVTPYDNSPSGGDAGATVTSDAFTVDNLPRQVITLNYNQATSTWVATEIFDKDTTPIFGFVMTAIRGNVTDRGLFPKIQVQDANGNVIMTMQSAASITGWEYEDSPGSWNTIPITGIPANAIDGTNKCRYMVQAGDALTADNDDAYKVFFWQGEYRDR